MDGSGSELVTGLERRKPYTGMSASIIGFSSFGGPLEVARNHRNHLRPEDDRRWASSTFPEAKNSIHTNDSNRTNSDCGTGFSASPLAKLSLVPRSALMDLLKSSAVPQRNM